MLAFLEARARQLAIVQLSADVSLCAEAFFRQAGFLVVERRLPVIGGIALANARMIKALG
ncbi:hypothetical protein D3C81_2285170 [compost metagenome]